MTAANKFCPIKQFKVLNDKPIWKTNELISIMKERNWCLRLYSTTKTEITKAKMRRARNLANVAVKSARADYIKEQLETHKNEPKKFFAEITAKS